MRQFMGLILHLRGRRRRRSALDRRAAKGCLWAAREPRVRPSANRLHMTVTQLLFRDDAYARDCDATVLAVTPDGGVVLDRTVFYAQGGGQPGDVGTLSRDSASVTVANTVYGPDRTTIVHVPAEKDWHVAPGERVRAELDWE